MTIMPIVGIVLALSIGIPTLFIVGARFVAFRIGGRPEALPSPLQEPITFPRAKVPALPGALGRLALFTAMGIGVGVIILRFAYGIGPVTNLSDEFTWGLWIGFDVMSGVALAAGGFVMAATAHIFKKERFEPLVRPAILTGLLGYLLVVAGLVVDLGRPYNVWRPLVFWQHRSVLWEVGVCVATYTTVLLIEFLPVILERVNQIKGVTKRLPTIPFYHLLKRISIVFVILGVVLSTLHQSSLGSLWVLLPTKLHPLWYSIYLPLFFFISAVAVGLAMTIVESTLSSKAFKRGLETDLLADLARAAAVVLAVYLVVRGVDLVMRDAWPLLFEFNLQSVAYWAELLLGVIVPMLLFASKRLREKPSVQFTGASMVVLFGIVLNRLNVSITAMLPYTGRVYAPAWTEVLVTLTLVSFGVLAFGLAAKYLPLFPEHPEH